MRALLFSFRGQGESARATIDRGPGVVEFCLAPKASSGIPIISMGFPISIHFCLVLFIKIDLCHCRTPWLSVFTKATLLLPRRRTAGVACTSLENSKPQSLPLAPRSPPSLSPFLCRRFPRSTLLIWIVRQVPSFLPQIRDQNKRKWRHQNLLRCINVAICSR